MAQTKTTKKVTTKKSAPVGEMKGKKEINNKKTMTGTVVSAKMQNTVVVAIERKVAHKLYRKLIKVTKRIKADTNKMDVKEGDLVVIEQTRPMSRGKNFRVIKKEGSV